MSASDLHPLALPEFLSARKAEGGIRAAFASELERQLASARELTGPVAADVAMAVRYAANALVFTLQRGHETAPAPSPVDDADFLLQLARNLRDAKELFDALRDDADGYGSATFSEILRALSALPASAGRALGDDPATDPHAPFADCPEPFPREVDVVRFHAGYVREHCADLDVRVRSLFLTRQDKVAALLRGIYPMVVEQQLFVARCLLELGAEGDFPTAAARAMEMSRLFFKAVGGKIDSRPFLYDGIVKQLARLLDAAEERGRKEPELATHLAAIETQRYGGAHPATQAAHDRMGRHQG